MRQIKILFLLMFVAMLNVPVEASQTLITAKLDSTILMMGKMTHLNVVVEQKKEAKGYFPIFSEVKEKGIAGVCGDSVELRAPIKADTSERNGKWHIEYAIPVQAFDSGYYQLPQIAFVIGRDTALSNTTALKVVPVNVEANTPIDDYANVADPENKSIFDAVPDWLLDYWWIILLVALVIAAAIVAWLKYQKDGQLIGKKIIPTPYEIAIDKLKKLKEQKLWEQGLEKEYYTELTDILRNYLYGRFGINAVEMTSRQILASLKNNKETKDKRDYFRQILSMADFVKFAKVRPLPEDSIASYDNAMRFVEETKPIVLPEENELSAKNTPKSKMSYDKKMSYNNKRSKSRKGVRDDV